MTAGIVSDRTEQLFTQAIEHHRAGRLVEAQALYREILALDERHAQALHHFGLVAHQFGSHDRAAELIGQAIAIDGAVPEFHYNLALVSKALGRLDQAIRHGERAVALSPDWAVAHHNLGTVLAMSGRLEDAVQRYRQALALDPSVSETYFELANALLALGRDEEAAEAFRQTLQRRPDSPEAHNNLGLAVSRIGRAAEAEAHYRRALSLKPDLAEALINLISALTAQGRAQEAIPLAQQLLRLRDDDTAKLLFSQSVKGAKGFPADAGFRSLLVRAVAEGWDRPTAFFPAILAILLNDGGTAECIKRVRAAWPDLPAAADLFGPAGLAPLAQDQLLSCLLLTGANIDFDMERFLTAARRALIETATAERPDVADADEVAFFSRLAAQCFINEYVFAESAWERAAVLELRDSVAAALKSGTPIDPLTLAAVASYLPLGSVPDAALLLEREWPHPVMHLLTQQVKEPEEERSYRSAVPRLTKIEDDVSAKVRRQYEENPYPRWVKPARYATRVSLDSHLRESFLSTSFRPLQKSEAVDILIAGCGTGRQAIERAQMIAGARVQAIDLSLDSLCYAIRKTRELGIDNIEYGQADLLEIGSLGRTFDLVEAGGVLHHLADPVAGWSALLEVLRPNGVMRLGFYSEIARAGIVAGQAFAAERGYSPTPEGIRRFRQDILAKVDDPSLRKIAGVTDFFTTSECRDLVFHVQEHRFTIPQIKAFLTEHELNFLGFSVPAAVRGGYSRMFPDDAAQTDLDNWHRFETQNPDTFMGMYEFWIQKRP